MGDPYKGMNLGRGLSKNGIILPTQDYIERVLFTPGEIQQRVSDLANQIVMHYTLMGVKEIVTIPMMGGADKFHMDLCDQLYLKSPCFSVIPDHVRGQRYHGTQGVGDFQFTSDLKGNIKDKHVLGVEDIVDEGYTAESFLRSLEKRNPSSVNFITLLDKKCKRKVYVNIGFVGFEVPDLFVIGYGMDLDERCRTWPFIGVLREEFYPK
ncbi:hypoxanthine phosphoribosyltransferase [Candidatus Pacearchaeota archaeon]|nr:hypoxanthine phosphoribosyltransferase [Candidatus Pacearchaeota archaeon]